MLHFVHPDILSIFPHLQAFLLGFSFHLCVFFNLAFALSLFDVVIRRYLPVIVLLQLTLLLMFYLPSYAFSLLLN